MLLACYEHPHNPLNWVVSVAGGSVHAAVEKVRCGLHGCQFLSGNLVPISVGQKNV